LAFLVAAVTSMSVGAVVAASPAYACGLDEDINILCSNEQAFINDLAAVGVSNCQYLWIKIAYAAKRIFLSDREWAR
jgi:hypothetical protein